MAAEEGISVTQGWNVGTLGHSPLTHLEPMVLLQWTVFPVPLCKPR